MDQDNLTLIASLVALAGVLARTLQEAISKRKNGNGGGISEGARVRIERLEADVKELLVIARKTDYDVNHPDGWLRRKHHKDGESLPGTIEGIVRFWLSEERKVK